MKRSAVPNSREPRRVDDDACDTDEELEKKELVVYGDEACATREGLSGVTKFGLVASKLVEIVGGGENAGFLCDTLCILGGRKGVDDGGASLAEY
mmetsp:Transcript_1742/g.2403  ORF Transcript_1742/g.2403 Transcript_1742/m.2403 type:complete len:95 (-) Transcript_1742:21-305(-)